MVLPTDPSAAKFTFSMLINDKRYRGYTFQFTALIILIFAMAYLGWNLTQNLTAKGLNISYQFLKVPAGYDINQRLIEYTSQSTHLRASMVGVAEYVTCCVSWVHNGNGDWSVCWNSSIVQQLDSRKADGNLCRSISECTSFDLDINCQWYFYRCFTTAAQLSGRKSRSDDALGCFRLYWAGHLRAETYF